MEFQTTRFGVINAEEGDIITFPRGMIGMADLSRFVMMPPAAREQAFYWLQSLDDPNVAFLVVDPSRFFKDYSVSIREETQADLNLADAKDGQLLVICNRVGEWITGNLQGPLVINARTRVAQQVVLTEKKWTCRQPLLKLEPGQSPVTARAA